MEAKIINYTTEGLDEFIYGIHLNLLEATSYTLRNLAQFIDD